MSIETSNQTSTIDHTDRLAFTPTREEALRRLENFAPRAGRAYAAKRNADLGPERRCDTSVLSPYLRRRMVAEREVVAATLEAHGLERAEKFVQEVCWRTYWKGWLEQRPAAWTRYLEERDAARDALSSGGAAALAAAENGAAGIDGFDDWARELVATGWLHNHTRMWFASIWIFTLGLPWTLGAAFFMRHLVDADPASNTLSWRWVAGLQTKGKTYLATAHNIDRYTEGRFAPKNLARRAEALTEAPLPAPRGLPAEVPLPEGPAVLLVTDEDLHPDFLLAAQRRWSAIVVAATNDVGQDGERGAPASSFAAGAITDAVERLRAAVGDVPVHQVEGLGSDAILAAILGAAGEPRTVVTAWAPVGATASAIDRLAQELAGAGVQLVRRRRRWDADFWPHANRGFFALREKIGAVLASDGLPV